MTLSSTFAILTGTLFLSLGLASGQESGLEKLEREVRQLQLQNSNLNQSLTAALEREELKAQALTKTREMLSLVGKDLFGEQETVLLDAATDYQVARESLEALESSVRDLLPTVEDYLRDAVDADPEARLAVEVKIREVEAALGFRQSPKRKIEQGTVHEARIVTIDSATGVAVMNAGALSDVSVGMRFRIERSGSHVCDAVVAVVRPHVSGLLIQSLNNSEVTVQAGDFAKVITVNSD